ASARASSASSSATEGLSAVSAMALSPSSSTAIFSTKVESTPPENATSAEPQPRSKARIEASLGKDDAHSASTWSSVIICPSADSHAAKGVNKKLPALLAGDLARLGHPRRSTRRPSPRPSRRLASLPRQRVRLHPLAGDRLELFGRHVAEIEQRLKHFAPTLFHRLGVGVHHHLRRIGRLVRL